MKTPIEDMSNEDLLKLQEGHITLIQNSQSELNQIAQVMQQRLEEPTLLKTYDFLIMNLITAAAIYVGDTATESGTRTHAISTLKGLVINL